MDEVKDDFYYVIHKHTLSWVIDKEPTVNEEGIKHEECSTCDYKGEAVPIDKLTPDTPSISRQMTSRQTIFRQQQAIIREQ